jgi:hydrogenase-4 membrane subunit HyfE
MQVKIRRHHRRPVITDRVDVSFRTVDYARQKRRSFWLLVSFSVSFVAGIIWFQFTSPRTPLRVTAGWIIGLSFTAAVVLFGLLWINSRREAADCDLDLPDRSQSPERIVDYARQKRRSFWSLVSFSVSFVAGIIWYQFTSPRTPLQMTAGWIIGLSCTAAVVSFGLFWINSRRDIIQSPERIVDYARQKRRSFWSLVSFSVFFVAGIIWYQFTSPRTSLQMTAGWIIGLSCTAVVVSFSLFWINSRRDRSQPPAR